MHKEYLVSFLLFRISAKYAVKNRYVIFDIPTDPPLGTKNAGAAGGCSGEASTFDPDHARAALGLSWLVFTRLFSFHFPLR